MSVKFMVHVKCSHPSGFHIYQLKISIYQNLYTIYIRLYTYNVQH